MVLILLLGVFAAAVLLAVYRMKKEAISVAMVGVALLLGFGATYIIFYTSPGLPAGDDLSNGDWLSFLSGYLGFAGSLVMAWLVYKQDKKLNELALEEYKPEIKVTVHGVEWKERSKGRSSTFSVPEAEMAKLRQDKKAECYLIHDFYLMKVSPGKQEMSKTEKYVAIYISLENCGKLSAREIEFGTIEIQEYGADTNAKVYRTKREKELLNGKCELLPGKNLNVCIVMHDVPDELPLSLLRIRYCFRMEGENQRCDREEELHLEIRREENTRIQISDGQNLYIN